MSAHAAVLLDVPAPGAELKETLPPSALAILSRLYTLRALAEKHREDMGKPHGEDESHDGTVWATADGRGWLQELDIEDGALSGSPEEVEAKISDVLITASGRGQAVGEVLRRTLDDDAIRVCGPS